MGNARVSDPETLRVMIARHKHWYHQIELAPGIVTPGDHPSAAELARLDAVGLPCNARGLRVLDIGCRDGFFSFEMERRGAEVVPIDYSEPAKTGFPIAAEALGSALQYRMRNVYKIDPASEGMFDIVLFLGLLYHLRNPMLALDQVRSVMKPGGLLFLSTHLATDARISGEGIPVWQFLPRDSFQSDASNKWIPNLAGLRATLAETRFNVLRETFQVARIDGLRELDRVGFMTAPEQARTSRHFIHLSARAVADDWLAFHRQLDESEGLWG